MASTVTKKFDFTTVTPQERASFNSRLAPGPNGCLEWTGSTIPLGYGQARFRGRVTRAHRIFFFMNTPRADQNKNVLHLCNNRKCCNVDHLRIGTHAENSNHMWKSERGSSVLTISEVISIRDVYSTGRFNQSEIAKMFGVTPNCIHYIVTRKSWKHI